MKKNWSSNRV